MIVLFYLSIMFSLILYSVIRSYRENKLNRQMILGILNPEDGTIKWISKYQKTWLDKLMEWLPQSIITAIATFTLTLMLFFDVKIDVDLTLWIGIVTGVGLFVIGKVLSELIKRREANKNKDNAENKKMSEVNHNEMSILPERDQVII